MRILVVDDDIDFREMLTEWLSRRGYDAHALRDEGGIFAALEATHYDVITLDIVMPKANGLTLLSQIRDRYPQTHVIIISATADVRTAIAAAKAGADTCLTKPLDFTRLRSELNCLNRVACHQAQAEALLSAQPELAST